MQTGPIVWGKRRSPLLYLESCTVDLKARRVERGGEYISLTEQEAELLETLARSAGQVLRREQLLEEVLGYAATSSSRALDAAVRRLRRKIERQPKNPSHLLSVYGVGYRLNLPEPVAAVTPPQRCWPKQAQPMLGRARLAQELAEALGRQSLITLHGPGGVGKTHLAIEGVAAAGLPLAQTMVRLQPGWDGLSLANEIAVQLGLERSRHPMDAVQLALDSDPHLLLLDGAEVAMDAVITVLSSLLPLGSGTRILVSSRERLALEMEHVIYVPPLDPGAAVELLRARARDARGGQAWCDADQEGVLAELVQALDALPLAIELAASRAPVLSPQQLFERLDARFEVLRRLRRRGEETEPETLYSTFSWSWELLEVPEQIAMLRLCVLTGPFTAAAGEALLGGPAGLEQLTQLVAKSMVQPSDAQGRLCILGSIRDFVLDASLPARAQEFQAATAALAAHAHRLELSAGDHLAGARGALAARLPSALPALQAAIDASVDAREILALATQARSVLDGEGLATLGVVVLPALLDHGGAQDLDAWIQVLSEQEIADPALRCEVFHARGQLLFARGRSSEALSCLERATVLAGPEMQASAWIALAEAQIGAANHRAAEQAATKGLAFASLNTAEEAHARTVLAQVARLADHDLQRSESMLLEALRIYRALEDGRGCVRALTELIPVRLRQMRLQEALQLSREAAQRARELGAVRRALLAMNYEATTRWILGDWRAARADFSAALQLARRLGQSAAEVIASVYVAWIRAEHLHELAAAQEVAQEAVDLARSGGLRAPLLFALKIQALLAWRAAQGAQVRAALQDAVALLRPDDTHFRVADLHVLRAHLLSAEDPRAAEESLSLAKGLLEQSEEDNVLLRVSWELAAGQLALASARIDAARGHHGTAERLLSGVELGPHSHHHRLLKELGEALGPSR